MTKAGYLMFGPICAFHSLLSHTVTGNSSFDHKYSVSVHRGGLMDKIPISALDGELSPDLISKCFTPEQREAIELCDIDLEKECSAHTDEEIIRMLSENPLNLNMVLDDKPVFLNPEPLVEILKAHGMGYVLAGKPGIKKVQKPNLVPVVKETESEGAEDAVFEEITEADAAVDYAALGWADEAEYEAAVNSFTDTDSFQRALFEKWQQESGKKIDFERLFVKDEKAVKATKRRW